MGMYYVKVERIVTEWRALRVGASTSEEAMRLAVEGPGKRPVVWDELASGDDAGASRWAAVFVEEHDERERRREETRKKYLEEEERQTYLRLKKKFEADPPAG